MKARLYNWFLYDVLLGILPVFVAAVFRDLASRAAVRAGEVARFDAELPEILFFVIVLNVTSIRDIQKAVVPVELHSTFAVLTSSQLICAVVAAILYGGVRFLRYIDPGSSISDLMSVALLIAVVFFAVAAVTQVLISRIEGRIARRY